VLKDIVNDRVTIRGAGFRLVRRNNHISAHDLVSSITTNEQRQIISQSTLYNMERNNKIIPAILLYSLESLLKIKNDIRKEYPMLLQNAFDITDEAINIR
jgi:hypothetical protein